MRRLALVLMLNSLACGGQAPEDLPVGFVRPQPDDLADNVHAGTRTSRRHLLVAVYGEEKRVIAHLASLGAEVRRLGKGVPILQLTFGKDYDVDRLETARRALLSSGLPIAASVDYVLSPQVLPERTDPIPPGWFWSQPPAGSNWGYERINAPLAWNLRDAIQRQAGPPVAVAVIDGEFSAHPDLDGILRLDDTRFVPPSRGSHGTQVAGLIGANFDNRLYAHGVTPFVDLIGRAAFDGSESADSAEEFVGEFSTTLEQMFRASADARVANVSLAIGWEKRCVTYPSGHVDRCDPRTTGRAPDGTECDPIAVQAHLAEAARVVSAVLAVMPAELLVVKAAGNASGPQLVVGQRYCASNGAPRGFGRFPAELADPITFAAIKNIDGAAEHIIVVEASQVGGTRAAFSSIGGDVFAPGQDVGVLAFDAQGQPTIATASGTSMSAPFVAGAAAYLLSIEPGLTNAELKQLLTSEQTTSHMPGVPEGPRELDLFEAAVGIDQLTGDRRVTRWLADMDDGSVDGFQLAETDLDGNIVALNTDDHRGDGRVDMKDFRRLRDSYWMKLNAELYREIELYPGGATHPKLDLNRDGLWDPRADEFFPRATIDGTPFVDEDEALYLNALRNDVEVMHEVFDGDPVQHYTAADLRNLTISADLWIHPQRALSTLRATALIIDVEGEGLEVTPEALIGHETRGDMLLLTTTKLDGASLLVHVICNGVEHPISARQQIGDLVPARDVQVEIDPALHGGCCEDGSPPTAEGKCPVSPPPMLPPCENVEGVYRYETMVDRGAAGYTNIIRVYTDTVTSTCSGGSCFELTQTRYERRDESGEVQTSQTSMTYPVSATLFCDQVVCAARAAGCLKNDRGEFHLYPAGAARGRTVTSPQGNQTTEEMWTYSRNSEACLVHQLNATPVGCCMNGLVRYRRDTGGEFCGI